MKVINNTHWRSDHLRAIISRVVNDELTPEKRARLVVTIDYIRRLQSYSSGCAPYFGSRMTVRISKHAEFANKVDFAKVVAHECAHLRGMRHSQMGHPYHAPNHARTPEQRAYFAWAEEMPLEQKPKRIKVVNIQEVRHATAIQHVTEWERKLKFAQTKLRKWRSKVRYYDRVAASKAAPTVS